MLRSRTKTYSFLSSLVSAARVAQVARGYNPYPARYLVDRSTDVPFSAPIPHYQYYSSLTLSTKLQHDTNCNSGDPISSLFSFSLSALAPLKPPLHKQNTQATSRRNRSGRVHSATDPADPACTRASRGGRGLCWRSPMDLVCS